MLTALALATSMLVPPIALDVAVAPTIRKSIVVEALDEAEAIWRSAGLRLSRRFSDVTVESAPGDVRVIVDESSGPPLDVGLPVGWTVFDRDGEPRPAVHLSYANAVAGLSYIAADLVRLPRARVDVLIARAIGRTLAHELGHYLLGSAAHARSGLMQADWSPENLFGDVRPTIDLSLVERATIVERAALLVKR